MILHWKQLVVLKNPIFLDILRSAALIAKYRPRCVIVAITRFPHTARTLHLHRGMLPVLYQGNLDIYYTYAKNIVT